MCKPNFIVFLTDDQGYGDLSCMGAEDLRTPNLDAIAASGIRFTNWYSNAPVCSPSRAALLTGRYPGNAGVRSILGGRRTEPGLPAEVPTLAKAFRQLGYRTGLVGKWHLGLAKGLRPEDHGFDEWFGFMAGCIDYYSHIFYWCMADNLNPIHDLWENGNETNRDGEYFTELITERAIAFIQESANGDRPFFLYVPYNAPHYPMHAPAKYRERFAHLPWDRQIMAAMLSAVDDSVGAILEELRRQGMIENTCVFFSSDNGPSRESRNWLDGREDPYYGGGAGKLKGHKFSLYEGGILMPALMSWPARIPSGQVCGEVGAAMDIFPTFVAAAGGNPCDYALDGHNILPMACEGAASPHDIVFWEMGKQTAARQGKWKLVLNGQLVEGAPSEDAVHLADLSEDMGERTNLAERYPDVTRELQGKTSAWRNGIENSWKEYWLPRANGKNSYT